MEWRTGPHAGQIGAAGVQLVAARMLLQQVTPCFPIWDDGYDLVSGYGDVLKRVQVKTTRTVDKDRQHLSTLRFSLYRRRPGSTATGSGPRRPKKTYAHGQFDVMVFVSLARNKVFVVPAHKIDFRRAYMYLPEDSEWLDAWWVLKEQQAPRAAAKRRNK